MDCLATPGVLIHGVRTSWVLGTQRQQVRKAQLGREGKTDSLYAFKELFLYHCSALLQLYEKGVVILILELGKERLREVKS